MSLLIGAAAVFLAVKFIEAVWTMLLVILGVGAFLTVAVMVLKHRRSGGW